MLKPKQDGAEMTPIWGHRAIAAKINRTPRQTAYLLDAGLIPAKKVGGRWVTTETALVKCLVPDLVENN